MFSLICYNFAGGSIALCAGMTGLWLTGAQQIISNSINYSLEDALINLQTGDMFKEKFWILDPYSEKCCQGYIAGNLKQWNIKTGTNLFDDV